MSPKGLMLVMAMLHVGAGGNTEKQMAKVLKLEKIEKDTLFCDMEQFIEKLREGNNSVQLKTANKNLSKFQKYCIR
jgi:serine protease inhibitor